MKRILILLDESGSMGESGKREETISGFNKWLDEQQAIPEDGTVVSLIKFNTAHANIYLDKAMKDVPKLTKETYVPGGMTALLDAVSSGCNSVSQADPTLVLILTDGEENSSRETTLAQVKELIESRKAGGWEFHFIGQGPQTWVDAMQRALGTQAAVVVQNNAFGTKAAYAYTSNTSKTWRGSH